jgi:formyl-CoA transferase
VTALPLAGLRVLEMGQLLASPFAGYMLAAFGADVIKIEPPGTGDPLRRWRKMHGDTSLWWYSLGRNKKSVTCNLREEAGRDLVRQMVTKGVDIVIENFRPGRMEQWGLGYDDLQRIDPRLIMVRISGYGQTGPYRERPGFANVAEAFGGLRHVTGEADRPPSRSAVSLGDTMAGMHAAYAALAAVHERTASGQGQEIDVALYEAVFNHMESLLPEYDLLGHVRERTGARLDGVVPSNTYACQDGKYVAIGANADSLYRRLMTLVGREDLANDPELAHNDGRVPRSRDIDDAITAWTSAHDQPFVLAELIRTEIPSGPINTIADMVADPHIQSRDILEPVTLPDGTRVRIPGVLPKMSRTPGRTKWVGPTLGEHNHQIYGEWLGLSDEELATLGANGVV